MMNKNAGIIGVETVEENTKMVVQTMRFTWMHMLVVY